MECSLDPRLLGYAVAQLRGARCRRATAGTAQLRNHRRWRSLSNAQLLHQLFRMIDGVHDPEHVLHVDVDRAGDRLGGRESRRRSIRSCRRRAGRRARLSRSGSASRSCRRSCRRWRGSSPARLSARGSMIRRVFAGSAAAASSAFGLRERLLPVFLLDDAAERGLRRVPGRVFRRIALDPAERDAQRGVRVGIERRAAADFAQQLEVARDGGATSRRSQAELALFVSLSSSGSSAAARSIIASWRAASCAAVSAEHLRPLVLRRRSSCSVELVEERCSMPPAAATASSIGLMR